MKFKIKWPSGVTEECEVSDCASLEEFQNSRFGSTWEDALANGVEVSVVEPEGEDKGEDKGSGE